MEKFPSNINVMYKISNAEIICIILLSLTGCTVMNNQEPLGKITMIDMVVVFKKEIVEDHAEKIMESFNYSYRKGMDSSRGKIYFYKTGPKFIVEIRTANRDSFIAQVEKCIEVYEVYQADWKIIKD